MRLRTGIALVGSLIAVGAIAAIYFTLGIGWISVLVVCVTVVAGYVLASVGAATSAGVFEEFMRGWLVGWNSALNGFILVAVVGLFAPVAVAALIGGVLGLLAFLSVFRPVSQSEFYQGVLGWFNWLMPMSWLIVGLGFVFCLICFIGHAFTVGKVAYLKVEDLGADWRTGTFFIKGGLISNLNYLDTAFNMGNFSFVDYKSGDWHKNHEAGHTLNLSAFGCVFHLIGALDENATPRGANAYSERLAESNASGTGGTNIPMWA